MNWILFWAVFLVVSVIGIGVSVGWWLWVRSQKTKMTWQARCYQLSKGTTIFEGDDNKISVKVNELVPYVKDVIVKEEPQSGVTYYRLAKQKISVGPVEADDVEVWGQEKVVSVLVYNGVAHILHKGYDKNTKAVLYNVMSRNEIELMNSEREIKKRNVRGDQVNKLAVIATIIGFVIAFLSILVTGYFMSKVFIDALDVQSQALEQNRQSTEALEKTLQALLPYLVEKDINRSTSVVIKGQGVEGTPSPPSIE